MTGVYCAVLTYKDRGTANMRRVQLGSCDYGLNVCIRNINRTQPLYLCKDIGVATTVNLDRIRSITIFSVET
ncbi:hypothetical protein RB195_023275 [Necator americanus]|uniref:Uncharacterized protein n=1 Tax=Necator americanus TaxID=51031 RepID=A0ABR1EIH8_NECAM